MTAASPPFSPPAAAVLLAVHALRGDACDGEEHADGDSTTLLSVATRKRLQRVLEAYCAHAPPAWRPLFPSWACPPLKPARQRRLDAAKKEEARTASFPRTLAELRALLGVHEPDEGAEEEEEDGDEAAGPPTAHARKRPRAAPRRADPVEVLPPEAVVHVLRFLSCR